MDSFSDLALFAQIAKLGSMAAAALTHPAVAARMTREGFDPLVSTPAQARARLERELPQWGKLVKDRGLERSAH